MLASQHSCARIFVACHHGGGLVPVRGVRLCSISAAHALPMSVLRFPLTESKNSLRSVDPSASSYSSACIIISTYRPSNTNKEARSSGLGGGGGEREGRRGGCEEERNCVQAAPQWE